MPSETGRAAAHREPQHKRGLQAAAAGDDTEAVKCWLEAMRNLRGNVEPELEKRLAGAYERLGDAAAARHHGSRAAC